MTYRKSEKGIMGRKHMGAEEAVKFIQKRRHCANPNPGFMRQLIKYENELPKTVKHNDVNNTTSEQVIKRDEAIRDAIKSIDEIKEELKSVDVYC